MPEETQPHDNLPPLTEEQIRTYTIGEPEQQSGRVVGYDPQWPEFFFSKTH